MAPRPGHTLPEDSSRAECLPNAIVFGSGRARTPQMFRHGVAMNLIGWAVASTVSFWLLG